MGYIKLDRKLFKHWIWQSTDEFSKRDAWIDLLQTAHYSEDQRKEHFSGKLIVLNRGELIGSIRYLKIRWNWRSNDKVARYLKLLESEKMISIQTGQGISVISISKYGDYNPINNYTPDADGTDTGQKTDADGTEKGQRRDEIKELKKLNKINKGEEITPSGASSFLSESLENDFLKVCKVIAEGSQVKKITNQLTAKQFSGIMEDSDLDAILRALEIMENTKSIINRTSVNLTIRNLIRKEDGSPDIKKWVPKFKEEYRVNISKISGGSVSDTRVTGREETALYSLIEFLKNNSTDKNYEGALKSFTYIFKHWGNLEPFYQNRVKISEINKDISNIIIQIKNNGANKTKSAAGSSKGDRKDY